MNTRPPRPGLIEGHAVALDIANLDTDQIMPKQFLRGIDKAGLDQGLLYDLRVDGQGSPRADSVFNQPWAQGADVLVAAPNYGCGSSREHAVWGMQQYGFRAVVAPSFGEIFYSNAMNNGLLLAMVSEGDGQILMQKTLQSQAVQACLAITLDVERLQVVAGDWRCTFTLSPRHQQMFLQGVDVIGASLLLRPQIAAFAARHWAQQPWLKDTARLVRDRLQG